MSCLGTVGRWIGIILNYHILRAAISPDAGKMLAERIPDGIAAACVEWQSVSMLTMAVAWWVGKSACNPLVQVEASSAWQINNELSPACSWPPSTSQAS
jgi:hypothetical protein